MQQSFGLSRCICKKSQYLISETCLKSNLYTKYKGKIDWLILMACQHALGYFLPRRLGIAFVVRPHLHLLCSCSFRRFLHTVPTNIAYRISNLNTVSINSRTVKKTGKKKKKRKKKTKNNSLSFIIKGFRTIVFIFIVISTAFRPICPPVFFRCLSNSGTFKELRRRPEGISAETLRK